MDKPLFIPLKKEWFLEFEAGRKRTEYRLYGPRWNEGTIIPNRPVILSLGYSGRRISAKVVRLRKIRNKNLDGIYPFNSVLAAIDLKVYL